MPVSTEDVLRFWLIETPVEKRFVRDKVLDEKIISQFGMLHEALSRDFDEKWKGDARSLLAAVIVLDQFSRNMYRDDPRAYAQDEKALELVYYALDQGFDQQLGVEEKWFLYMPLMHSETLADQDLGVKLFRQLDMPDVMDFAIRHRDQIERFGRFPQRNEVLGRQTTAEEEAFLEQPGSRF